MTVFMIYTFREAELLGRVVRALAPHQVVVHVDAKVAQGPFESAIRTEDKDRVLFIKNRIQVNWAGYSQVETIRRLVAEGIRLAAAEEYLVMLSGQDYPIRPMSELEKYFEDGVGKQYIRYFEIAGTEPKYTSRAFRRHFRDLGFLSKYTRNPNLRKMRNALIRALEMASRLTPELNPPPGLKVAQGATHFAITASFARELESLVTPEIESYFRKIFCPEEKFYHSLAAMSRRASETGGALPGGFEAYAGPGESRYANLHHIDPSLVKVYTESDWEEVRTSQKFFLRKLESGRSGRLLQMIDEELLWSPQLPAS